MKYLLAVLLLFVSSMAGSGQSMFDKVNDFDGDAKADYAVIRHETGQKIWYLWRSSAGFGAVNWGLTDDVVTAGDYDGDSRTDIAVTRLGSGPNGWIATTYYLTSANSALGVVQVEAPNASGSLGIMNEDYDGDGKTDPGIFQWHAIGALNYKRSSTNTQSGISMNWFQVRTGDLIGNSAVDVTSTDPNSGQTTIKNMEQGGEVIVAFGMQGDRWVAADFDGDNKGEIAIFRRSTGDWWWIRSSDFVVNVAHFGVNGDIPVPADYDGDGKSDLAVYRPASPQSIFYVLGSTAGFSAFGFGVATDTVVTY